MVSIWRCISAAGIEGEKISTLPPKSGVAVCANFACEKTGLSEIKATPEKKAARATEQRSGMTMTFRDLRQSIDRTVRILSAGGRFGQPQGIWPIARRQLKRFTQCDRSGENGQRQR